MLEINLLPVREARRKADLRQFVMQLILAVIVAAGGIGLLQSRIGDQIERANGRVRQMTSDIQQFQPQLEQVAAFKKRKSELEKKIDVIDGLDRARSGPVRVLDELATRTPDRLWLTELRTKGGRIELKGESLDNEIVALFLRSLGDSVYFENVDLEGTKLAGDRGGLKLVRFEIEADLVNPEQKRIDAANEKTKKKKKKKKKA